MSLIILILFIVFASGCTKKDNQKEYTITCTLNNDDVSNGYKMSETKKVVYSNDQTMISAESQIDIKFLNNEAKNAMQSIIDSYESLKNEYNNDKFYQGVKLEVENKDNEFKITYTYDISKLSTDLLEENEFKKYILKNNRFNLNQFEIDNREVDAICKTK